ncbi:MAG: cysteine synthase family protein [Deferribacteres bacterium]|nr:cysteine synthase family protein [candidate division KSB1 bacterium]MCB9501358.1 cysteine synthase family protein [Deferribacteres bacterium]
MRNLKDLNEYHVGNTPLYHAKSYCPSQNLYLKLEMLNPLGSIKDRTAYYILKNLIDTGRLTSDIKIVESSSGNLGLALNYFACDIGIYFRCLIDPTVPQEKQKQLEDADIDVYVVALDDNPDYRTARIQLAKELNQQKDWIWTNQYNNPANVQAHYETTGPEIWLQTRGSVDYVVCSVGTGGTICGIGRYLKQQNFSIKIIAVEPDGSTAFGGQPGKYLSVGSGMRGQSGIFKLYGHVVDYYCKVKDLDALQECVNFFSAENISIGVTTGSVLVVASCIALRYPKSKIVVIAPDDGEKYFDLFEGISPDKHHCDDVILHPYVNK